MATVQVSLRLDEKEKARLEQDAKRQGRSASYIHNTALKQYLDRQERRRMMLDQALEDADQGHFISQSVMHAWVDTWGNDSEKALPEVDLQFIK
jgi:predicted transcriptional regulator